MRLIQVNYTTHSSSKWVIVCTLDWTSQNVIKLNTGHLSSSRYDNVLQIFDIETCYLAVVTLSWFIVENSSSLLLFGNVRNVSSNILTWDLTHNSKYLHKYRPPALFKSCSIILTRVVIGVSYTETWFHSNCGLDLGDIFMLSITSTITRSSI